MSLNEDSSAFLKEVYNEVECDTNKFVSIVEIAKKIEIEDLNHILTIVNNLKTEKHLKAEILQGVSNTVARITTSGINAVEKHNK
ncbi:hypothetical protein SPBRAN_1760 [uncultured Candidatus Thioglobus sp.]|nr:hypothetical protein SPBRAN_1760 [uncultured Candidatus Thioglobus sp.]